MPLEILNVLIAMLAGTAGYFFREYSSKAEPFFQILTIGDNTKNDDDVSITPKLIADLSSDTFYLPTLDPTLDKEVKYGKIFDLQNKIDDIKNFSTDVRQAVDRVLLAQTDYEFVDTLSELFHFTFFDIWMYRLLFSEKLSLIDISSDSEEKIKVYDDDSSEGSVWISFPQKPVNFGQNLKSPVVRAKYNVFLEGVKHLDRHFLEQALKSFKDRLDRECQISNEIFEEVKDLRNNHSRWGICAYIANLNNYPLIIETESTVLIKDKRTGVFSENCELAIVNVSDDGRLNLIRPANMPIVLQPSSSIQLGFITKKTQGDMSLGADIRAAFNRKQASCQVEIRVRKTGLFKRRTYKSAKAPFVETQL